MRNLFKEFIELIPDPSLQVGTILSKGDGFCNVELPGGGRLRARGDGTVGTPVFVRGNVIEGAAPDLPVEIIEI